MAKYIDKNKLDMAFVDRCAGDCGCCSYWETESYGHDCNLIHNFPPEDVVEREKIDKAIEEIEQLINHSKLPTVNIYNRYSDGLKDCLEILKRNIGE